MSSEDIATALLRKALDHKGITGWPNPESLHNTDLYESVVYAVEDYNSLFTERLNPETFINWEVDDKGVISVMGNPKQMNAAFRVLSSVEYFLNNYEETYNEP